MKTLIVYYSRSNTTKKVAEYLKSKLGADIEEVTTPVNYGGAIGYAKGIKDSVQEKVIEIGNLKYDPGDYDRVIIGTPVWTSKLANPILTYIKKNNSLKNVSLFIVGKSNGFEKVEEHFTKVSGVKPQKTTYILEKEINDNTFENKADALL
ncbi:MAG: flavodoxin [Methanobrevibacter sp.]|uniref:flavodoxin family protein n=1 Tax=Methanobrevibacter sp. TaxID=66852 RepID=UPI0025EBE5ED|nr:flavodoxin [Methanobrevibacter sp.]MBR0271748.1 flavodoxin [Methanobrevibacter sp.]